MSGTFLSCDRRPGTSATRAEVRDNNERNTVSPVRRPVGSIQSPFHHSPLEPRGNPVLSDGIIISRESSIEYPASRIQHPESNFSSL